MYRDLCIRAYGDEEMSKIDELREAGVNITELVLKVIMEYEIASDLELVS